MIPLVISFVAYFNLFTNSIANAVSRFVAIHLDKGAIEESNIYLNSALFALAVLCGALLFPVIIVSLLFSRLFQVPSGFEAETGWLFFYVMLSSFIMVVTSPFLVSTFVRHRFDLNNLVRMLSKFLQVIILVMCFRYLSASLTYFGLSYCGMALFLLVCSVILTRYLTPQLRIKRKSFNRGALREMGPMSVWLTINDVGALLYINISFVIINVFLGPKQCGRYGPIALLVTLLMTLGAAIGSVFAPIAYEYVARDRTDILAYQAHRSTKFMGLIMGLLVGLVCGLSRPLLKCWLVDPTFTDLSPLVWLLVGPLLVSIAVAPVVSVFRGLGRVKVPAIVTLVIGIVNVLLCVLLVRYTDLGLYGVALAVLLCLTGKNFFFTPIYAAIITGQPKRVFIRGIIPGLVMASVVSLVTLALSRRYELASIPRLLVVGVLMFASYAPLCYGIILGKEDRSLLWSIIYRRG